jgi:hypothetical protein
MERRTLTIWGYRAAAIVGGTLLVFLPTQLIGGRVQGEPDVTSIVVATIAAAIAMGWTLYFARRADHRGDEFMRARSKTSWYLGSSVGVALSLPVFAFVALGGLHWIDPSIPTGRPLALAFSYGYLLPVVMQLLGYFVAYAWWTRAKS